MTTTAQRTVSATPARPGAAALPREGRGAGARGAASDAVPLSRARAEIEPSARHGDSPPGGVGRSRADDAGEAALRSVTRRAHPTGQCDVAREGVLRGPGIAQQWSGRWVNAKRWEAD